MSIPTNLKKKCNIHLFCGFLANPTLTNDLREMRRCTISLTRCFFAKHKSIGLTWRASLVWYKKKVTTLQTFASFMSPFFSAGSNLFRRLAYASIFSRQARTIRHQMHDSAPPVTRHDTQTRLMMESSVNRLDEVLSTGLKNFASHGSCMFQLSKKFHTFTVAYFLKPRLSWFSPLIPCFACVLPIPRSLHTLN